MVADETIADMLDKLLAWLVILAPFALSAVFILIPSKVENRSAHMRWRWAILLFGVMFSFVAWWQQSRAAKAATIASQDAIKQTYERVASEVKSADKVIIDAQDLKIDNLQKSLDAQGKTVAGIGDSPFVTGKVPVKVEVTNGAATSAAEQPSADGPITWIPTSITSDAKDYPYEQKLVIQSRENIQPFILDIRFTAPVAESMLPSCNIGDGVGLYYKRMSPDRLAYGQKWDLVTPDMPIVCHFYAKQAFRVASVALVR